MAEERQVAATSTHALYVILKEYADCFTDGASSPSFAWQTVLDKKAYSPEFARMHGEVMVLWADALNEIASIAPEKVGKRLSDSITSWWERMVLPRDDWNESLTPFIGDSDLDLLATADELIASQSGGSIVANASDDLQSLLGSCEEWIALLSQSDQIQDDNFRQVLTAQIQHLMWLISRAETFGLAHIVQQGDKVTGTLVRATQSQGVTGNWPLIRAKVSSFIAALTMVANLIHSSQVVYDNADHALSSVEKVVKELTEGKRGPEDYNETSSFGSDSLIS